MASIQFGGYSIGPPFRLRRLVYLPQATRSVSWHPASISLHRCHTPVLELGLRAHHGEHRGLVGAQHHVQAAWHEGSEVHLIQGELLQGKRGVTSEPTQHELRSRSLP